MRTAALVVIALGLLALEWAALDDILAGSQASYAWEYATLMASTAIFAGLIVLAAQRARGRALSLRTALLTALVVLLLALDWAALHDILKGNEPSYRMEYAILAFSLMVFGVMALGAARRRFHTSRPS